MTARAGNLYRIASEHSAEIRRMVNDYKRMAGGGGDEGHCAACIAHDFFRLTNKQWNSPAGGEYFAAIMALIAYKKMY